MVRLFRPWSRPPATPPVATFLDFFTAHIRNPHTRAAYARGVGHFLAWCEAGGLTDLRAIEPRHVALYGEKE